MSAVSQCFCAVRNDGYGMPLAQISAERIAAHWAATQERIAAQRTLAT